MVGHTIDWDDIKPCTHCENQFDMAELEEDLLGDYICIECAEAKELLKDDE